MDPTASARPISRSRHDLPTHGCTSLAAYLLQNVPRCGGYALEERLDLRTGPADWTCRAPNPGVLLFSEFLSGTGHLLHSWPNPCLMLTGPQLGCSGSMPCRGFQIGPLVGLAVLLADSIITSSAKRGWHILCIRQPTMQYRALRIWSELCRSISDPNYDSLGRRSLPWKLHVLCPSVSICSSDPAPSLDNGVIKQNVEWGSLFFFRPYLPVEVVKY